MKSGIKFTEVATGTTQTFNLPYFNSVLEAKQHLASVVTAISEVMVANLNARVEAGIMYTALESVIPAYMTCAFTGGGYNASYAATPIYVSGGVASCAIIPNEYFKLYKNGALTLEPTTYNVNGTLITFNSANTGPGSGDYKATWSNCINSTQGYPIGVSHNIMCSGYNGAFGSSGAHITAFGNSMLSMACIVPLTDNSVSLQFYQVQNDSGFYTGNIYSGFHTIDGVAWVNDRSKFNEQYYTVTPPTTEQPTISGDPTADIDTDTGESETQDSEDNVGGAGNVTLINNVVNYDNYSPNYARVNTGFITPFEVDSTNLNTLHSFLYSETILDLIKNYFAGDATKAIVDLFNIPISPAVEPTSTEIKVGVVGTGAVGNVLSSETATFDFGSIDITQGYNSNSFMDLDPYNKYMIFLPFIGFKTLNTNDIRSINDTGFKIYLKYIVDMLTGDFVAVIEADHNNAVFDNDTGTLTTAKLTKQVINTFSGNMRTAIPLNSINSREAITPALGALATAIAGASTGNPLVMAQSVGSSLNSMANYNNALIPRGDSLSGNIGNLTINKAFIVNQESPKYIRTGKSNQLVGYPVYKYMKITKDRGYVKVKDLIMSGFTGTAKEAEALEALLKGGVWTQ